MEDFVSGCVDESDVSVEVDVVISADIDSVELVCGSCFSRNSNDLCIKRRPCSGGKLSKSVPQIPLDISILPFWIQKILP